jgi:broad specificity phosphatase PhoE
MATLHPGQPIRLRVQEKPKINRPTVTVEETPIRSARRTTSADSYFVVPVFPPEEATFRVPRGKSEVQEVQPLRAQAHFCGFKLDRPETEFALAREEPQLQLSKAEPSGHNMSATRQSKNRATKQVILMVHGEPEVPDRTARFSVGERLSERGRRQCVAAGQYLWRLISSGALGGPTQLTALICAQEAAEMTTCAIVFETMSGIDSPGLTPSPVIPPHLEILQDERLQLISASDLDAFFDKHRATASGIDAILEQTEIDSASLEIYVVCPLVAQLTACRVLQLPVSSALNFKFAHASLTIIEVNAGGQPSLLSCGCISYLNPRDVSIPTL